MIGLYENIDKGINQNGRHYTYQALSASEKNRSTPRAEKAAIKQLGSQ
jgi:hypothetical protein